MSIEAKAEIYRGQSIEWESGLAPTPIITIGPDASPLEERDMLSDDSSIIAFLLNANSKVIGYSVARPASPDTVGIHLTRIHPELRGQGLVGVLMETLEEELRERGYQYMERHAVVDNGYADKVERHYKERIVFSEDEGKTRFFRIRIGR